MAQKITAIKLQKKNPNRVNIYLDEEFGFGLSKIIAARLSIGQELTQEEIQDLLNQDEKEVAYQRALHFLSFRIRSEKEVRDNLTKHGTSPQAITSVIERLKELKLINDFGFAKSWVENRNTFHPRSKLALSVELRQKGISEEIIQHVVSQINDEEMAYQLAQKQSRKYIHEDWPVFRKKLTAYLARKGFNYGTISPIVQKVWTETYQNNHETAT